jgi:hypothetical protein
MLTELMQETEEESALTVLTIQHSSAWKNEWICSHFWQSSNSGELRFLFHSTATRNRIEILLLCSFCRRSSSLNTQELQYFLFTDRWLSQTKTTETKDWIQRLHSPLGLIRSSSPQSEAINTALIKSPSEKTQQKPKT